MNPKSHTLARTQWHCLSIVSSARETGVWEAGGWKVSSPVGVGKLGVPVPNIVRVSSLDGSKWQDTGEMFGQECFESRHQLPVSKAFLHTARVEVLLAEVDVLRPEVILP
jgi:hypothetical protein